MPESKKRKKPVTAAPVVAKTPKKRGPSPVWVPALMLTLFVVGIVWLVVFYIGGADKPVPIGNMNLLAGFGFIVAGFAVATQWR